MYQSLYVPCDNSAHALTGLDIAIAIAKACGARITASHVFAAALHDRRFRQMESGLPEPYRAEDKLVEQRDIHDDLITRGLSIISGSYLDVAVEHSRTAGLDCGRVSLEGKNWQRLVADIAASDHDLVVIGALGLGAVPESLIGSVCERVARRIDRDLLVVRQTDATAAGPIVVAIDGSAASFGGLKAALALGRMLERPVEAVAAFDPYFHYVAFNGIARVLSPEAATVFRFKEQEKLHEEIIDSGLAKIYQANLDLASRIAAEEGVALKTTLLAGKPFEQVLKFTRERKPWLLVLGRIGVHSEAGMDLGGTTENLLRLAPCNLLLAARTFTPAIEAIAETTMTWTTEAEARMARVPAAVQGMARRAILRHAAQQGHTVVTSDVIDACLGTLMPAGAMEAMTAVVAADDAKCPFAGLGGTVSWTPEAEERLATVADPSRRANMRLRIEKMARRGRRLAVDAALVETALADTDVEAAGLPWEPAARTLLERVPAGFMRERAVERIEALAQKQGATTVTPAIAEEALAESRRLLAGMLGEAAVGLLP